ncbi:hypothetical protein FRC07_006738 [Ceratobasidium sp. 392]|nr:hypothetical protein FRC07_006738 [Ceratobasidium sp. 392]
MSTRLNKVPELVEAILEIDGYTTGHALMLSCRRFFLWLAPHFWKHVKGAEQIFALLPGAVVNINHRTRTVKVKLPQSVKDNDLTRLKFYAEYIQDLEVFRFGDYSYTFSHLDSLKMLPTNIPLLPSILSLSFENLQWLAHGRYSQLPLLLMFLSPSLLEYRTAHSTIEESPCLTASVAIDLLRDLGILRAPSR